ncbi:MAG: patatin-like phospholipase family protein [Anaerolineae bacterium]|nr:patatin-like phospholipase family protein [Anaerolineae bacterium]
MRDIPQLNKKKGTALVLGGGAIKGFYYHLGVLKALEDAGEDITAIVGTSAGAIIGALAAGGISASTLMSSVGAKKLYSPERDIWVQPLTSVTLFKPIYHNYLRQYFSFLQESAKFIASFPRLIGRDIVNEALDRLIGNQTEIIGLFDPSALEKLLNVLLPTQNFAENNIDLYVTASFLDNPHQRAVFNGNYHFEDAENHFLTNIPISRAVRASSAIPGVFEPVKIGDHYYVDGEIKQTLSADIGIRIADRVIISHSYQPLHLNGTGSVREMGWLNVLKQGIYTVFYERINTWRNIYGQQNPGKAIIWIEPDPTDTEFFLAPEFSFRPEVQQLLIEKGMQAAQKALATVTVKPLAPIPQ